MSMYKSYFFTGLRQPVYLFMFQQVKEQILNPYKGGTAVLTWGIDNYS